MCASGSSQKCDSKKVWHREIVLLGDRWQECVKERRIILQDRSHSSISLLVRLERVFGGTKKEVDQPTRRNFLGLGMVQYFFWDYDLRRSQNFMTICKNGRMVLIYIFTGHCSVWKNLFNALCRLYSFLRRARENSHV